jgi:hypothetical protein
MSDPVQGYSDVLAASAYRTEQDVQHRASLEICRRAVDAKEARELMLMLGLIRPVTP